MPTEAESNHFSLHSLPQGLKLLHLLTENGAVYSVANGHQNAYSRASMLFSSKKVSEKKSMGKHKNLRVEQPIRNKNNFKNL